ncbi:MAG: hypothetical protein SGJ24_17645 [Chloroflexota bacterium]|nr:hypothetical protein [Chloroflexota bacterium]
MTRRARLDAIALPDFGTPADAPFDAGTDELLLPASIYHARLERLNARAADLGCDVLVVYGDREHFANLAYLCGYDPRFEESVLLIDVRGRKAPHILVGNEGTSYIRISPILADMTVERYQPLSLLGQPRDSTRAFTTICADYGIGSGTRVGTIGWKYYSAIEGESADTAIELPSFMVDALRNLTGDRALVRNVTALLMRARDGLRAVNEVEQLARYEYAACFSSDAVRAVIAGAQPGMTEYEALAHMNPRGIPLNAHMMLSSGLRTRYGMASPSGKRLVRGEPIVVAVGLWGTLTCRAGFLVESADELPESIRDYLDKLAIPYFEAIAAWYETIGIGVAGGDLHRVIHDRIGDPFFGVFLNPGHLIGQDEWIDAPIYAGSDVPLRSGMALQVDVIPGTGTDYFSSNIEDGIALADEPLREAFASRYPEAWGRIMARRAFMGEVLGIQLKPEVLPFSNLAAVLPPFWLAQGQALRMG